MAKPAPTHQGEASLGSEEQPHFRRGAAAQDDWLAVAA